MQKRLPKFQYIEHTADVGIQIFAQSRKELFEHAAEGMFDIIADLDSVTVKSEQEVNVKASDCEALMVSWLSELNFLYLTEEILLKEFQIVRLNDNELSAMVRGEPLDFDKHKIHTEIKAVTYHHLYIKEKEGIWEAQIIFDL